MPYFGVSAHINGTEQEIYDGTDYNTAERLAISAHKLHHGNAYVSVLLDGGTWMAVAHIPGDLSTAQLTEPSCCLHPRCGEINPLYCYCADRMDAETKERYRQYEQA